ncbi:hypothetical protein PTTG_30198 [Puccinia triticina 1-1 BBBD Race 1]|uniref:OB_Dis3 domain-containing protein n=2 Tax=Puccinia triticina TaxID=208348 RepID=A0A180FZV6_PUCT1|nr:uncharacterized protein PtA15_5A863 [Puccinia triticina]OAV85907.1 hypothetical protein PTTG_30198 [Puccinia triticina 1-1 BBBD Race 1]WAQ85288.1 hypothetical protein PtA15_5A863 [Puccinia triticina]
MPNNPNTISYTFILTAHIVTFDNYGVSSHINHRAVFASVTELAIALCKKSLAPGSTTKAPQLFTVKSVFVVQKYLALFDLPLSFIRLVPSLVQGPLQQNNAALNPLTYDPKNQKSTRESERQRVALPAGFEKRILGTYPLREEEVKNEQRSNFAGHNVPVVKRVPAQLFGGTLGLLHPSSAATKEKQASERRKHRPTTKQASLIAIPVNQAPVDFLADPNKYSSTLFIAGIKQCPITSLHPFGTLVEELGPIGDIEVEPDSLLKNCNFTLEEFSKNVVSFLLPLPWTIPKRE